MWNLHSEKLTLTDISMLRLPPFEYYSPESIPEAVALKARFGNDAMYAAGGTDLYPNMKRRQYTPQYLIGLHELKELNSIDFDNGMTIGSGIPLNEVANHPEIQKLYPALANAASLVSAPQLRNVGTIGGNLCLDTRCTYYNQTYPWRKALGFCLKKDGDICWVARSSPVCLAVSSSDCAPVAVALNAEYRLAGRNGQKIIAAENFYLNDGIDYLNKTHDELLVSIYIPSHEGWLMSYNKMRRRDSIDFPVLSVATALSLDKAGVCTSARIVLGAVASCPQRALEAEKILTGEKLSAEIIETSAQTAAKLAKPMDNTDMTLGFRKKMVSGFVKDAINDALE
jgi:4-hydroxybenzoyl-CoA reductase subunit beta